MAKKITDFIEDNQTQFAAIQAYIPADLRHSVVAQIKADKRHGIKITWDTLIESACRAYLAERKGQSKGA